METIVKARIVKIGNSHGVRIPKAWLDQLNFGEEVELVVQSDQLVIRSPHQPRQDWAAQFAAMAVHKDDRLLEAETPTRWEQEEWEW